MSAMTSSSSTAAPARRSIAQTFAALRSKSQIGLMPFIPAGFPDLATTEAVLPALEASGANLIEIGFPFSDPIADGPTIQEAFTAALAKKLRVADVFASIGRVRPSVSIPLVAMLSYSIVFRYGVDRFLADAASAGFDGLILPDLPPPEAQTVCAKIRAAGLDTILLVAPTTPADRRQKIISLCSGFVYYLSVSGITGARDRLPEDLPGHVKQIRAIAQVPVCVGFGVSKPEHVAELAPLADGTIVGSAFVKRMRQHEQDGPQAIAQAVAAYCQELLSKVR